MKVRGFGLLALVLCALSAPARADEKSDAAQEFSRGLAAMSRGDLDEATKRFDAVLKLDPQSFEAHNNLAVIYTEQKKYDAALEQLQDVMKIRPDYYRGRKNLAELYSRMAHEAFLDAAELAPPEEKERLNTRARLIGAPPGSAAAGAVAGGVLEPASGAPAAAEAKNGAVAPTAVKVESAPATAPAVAAAPAAPAAAPASSPAATAPDVLPAEFIALLEGVPALSLSDGGMRLYRMIGGDVTPADRIPVKQNAKLPKETALYVAVPGDGRVDLVPLARGGKPLSIRDTASGNADVVIDSQAFGPFQQSLQGYLSPAVVGAALRPADPKVAETKHLAVLQAFTNWMKSWEGKNLDGYLASYIPDYNPRGGPGAAKWREQRAKVFERSGDISVSLSDPVILENGAEVLTLARQDYRSKLQNSVGVKKLTWTLTPQGWKISGEEMLSEKIEKAKAK